MDSEKQSDAQNLFDSMLRTLCEYSIYMKYDDSSVLKPLALANKTCYDAVTKTEKNRQQTLIENSAPLLKDLWGFEDDEEKPIIVCNKLGNSLGWVQKCCGCLSPYKSKCRCLSGGGNQNVRELVPAVLYRLQSAGWDHEMVYKGGWSYSSTLRPKIVKTCVESSLFWKIIERSDENWSDVYIPKQNECMKWDIAKTPYDHHFWYRNLAISQPFFDEHNRLAVYETNDDTPLGCRSQYSIKRTLDGEGDHAIYQARLILGDDPKRRPLRWMYRYWPTFYDVLCKGGTHKYMDDCTEVIDATALIEEAFGFSKDKMKIVHEIVPAIGDPFLFDRANHCSPLIVARCAQLGGNKEVAAGFLWLYERAKLYHVDEEHMSNLRVDRLGNAVDTNGIGYDFWEQNDNAVSCANILAQCAINDLPAAYEQHIAEKMKNLPKLTFIGPRQWRKYVVELRTRNDIVELARVWKYERDSLPTWEIVSYKVPAALKKDSVTHAVYDYRLKKFFIIAGTMLYSCKETAEGSDPESLSILTPEEHVIGIKEMTEVQEDNTIHVKIHKMAWLNFFWDCTKRVNPASMTLDTEWKFCWHFLNPCYVLCSMLNLFLGLF
jgi:hypothetical protein